MSSLLADWNCLQVQVERSMSSATAGALHASIDTARTAAKVLIAAPLLLEMQVRGPDHLAEFDDIAVDGTHKVLGRTAAGIGRQIFKLRRHAGIADRLAQAL